MKSGKTVALFLFLALALPATDLCAQQRKKVGVVLSGGGAKGVAHIGVLRVLEEAGIPIDFIAGTSMGAIVGGLYAIGYDAATLDTLVRNQNWNFLLSDKVYRYNLPFTEKEMTEKYLLSVPLKKRRMAMPSGFVSGQNIYNLFLDLTVGYHDSLDFSRFPIPFACVASDLVDGSEVILDRGRLAQAMRASMAIPGAFAPVLENNKVLVDGGIANNLPADLARQMGADILIGVDVQAELRDEKGLESVMGIVDQLSSLLGLAKYEENIKLLDLYIKPDIIPYSAASFSRGAIDTLILRGETAARSQWEELLALKATIGGESLPRTVKRPMAGTWGGRDTVRVNQILLEGVDRRDEKWLRSIINLDNYSKITMEEIRRSISQIYGSGAFDRVSFRLSGAGPRYDLIFSMEGKPSDSFHLGFRFDSEEMAAILLTTTFGHKSMWGSRISFTGRLSSNPYLTLDYSLGNTFMRRFNLSYTFRYNDLGVYYKGNRQDNITFRYHQAELGIGNLSFRNNFRMMLGLRYRYYDYESFLYSGRDERVEVKPEGFFSYYATAQVETLDKRYYPDRGFSLRMSGSVYTDDLIDFNGGTPLLTLTLAYEPVISLSRRVKLLPAVHGRVIMGNEEPYPLLNCFGGTIAGRYMPQQIAFTGVQNLEQGHSAMVVGRLQLRYRLGERHYVSLLGNGLFHDDDFFNLLKGEKLWGGSVGYSHNSIIGPIDIILSYSDWTKNLGFFFNLGYYF